MERQSKSIATDAVPRRVLTRTDAACLSSFSSLPLLPDETVVFSSSILLPSSTHTFSKSLHLPTKPRERLLFLTDFPRILCIKHDAKGSGTLKVKSECLILRRGTGASRVGNAVGGGGNVLKSIKEKGPKGFAVVSVSTQMIRGLSRRGKSWAMADMLL